MNSRIETLRRSLPENHIDALVVSSPVNIRYLTGFTGDSSALLVTRDRAIIVSDFRYEEQIGQECAGPEVRIRPVERSLWLEVVDAVSLLGLSTLAYEANAMLVADQITLVHGLPSVELTAAFGRVEAIRAIKDEGEVREIRAAVRAAERAFRMLCDGLDLGESEVQAADLLETYLKRCGSSRPAFDPIVASGPRSALPHATPEPGRPLGDFPFALIDWGATVSGYRSDLTRMVVAGNVGDEFRQVYEAVLSAQERAIAAIHPGARAKDVDAVARSAIADAGFAGRFGHGLGHGLGLALHEAPSVRPDSDAVLEAGMVVTIEPGIYLPGWGGIRIEDDILVTSDGREVLSHLPKSFDSLSLP